MSLSQSERSKVEALCVQAREILEAIRPLELKLEKFEKQIKDMGLRSVVGHPTWSADVGWVGGTISHVYEELVEMLGGKKDEDEGDR